MYLLTSLARSRTALARAATPTATTTPLAAAAAAASGLSSVPAVQARWSSYAAPATPSATGRKKVTIPTLRTMHRRGEPITMLTAHDFPTGLVADAAGMDVILVGDSLAMVALGMEDTTEVLVEEMLLHCRSVARATKAAFLVCQCTRSRETCFCFAAIHMDNMYMCLCL